MRKLIDASRSRSLGGVAGYGRESEVKGTQTKRES